MTSDESVTLPSIVSDAVSVDVSESHERVSSSDAVIDAESVHDSS